jgi:hypothetical protein
MPACHGDDSGAASACSPLIYDSDDRIDVGSAADMEWSDWSDRCVVSLIPKEFLGPEGPGVVALSAPLQAVQFNLCPEVAGGAEPAASVCTGVLFGDSTVLTAAHCANYCADLAFVRGYRREPSGELRTLAEADVFRCSAAVLVAASVEADGPQVDMAWLSLDHATDMPCLPRVRAGGVSTGERLVVLGTPLGAPIKMDQGAYVRDARAGQTDYFLAASDTFIGSSGSSVFDSEKRLIGYMVGGGEDFILDQDRQCQLPRTVTVPAREPGERTAFLEQALAALCRVEPEHPACGLERERSGCGAGR